MKAPKPVSAAATVALGALYACDPLSLERQFQHLTAPTLERLDASLENEMRLPAVLEDVSDSDERSQQCCYSVVAEALLRRMVHKQLDKYRSTNSSSTDKKIEEALKHYTLPPELQTELVERYGTCTNSTNPDPPATWMDALNRLREIAQDDSNALWRLVLDHPMTTYIPVQCQTCGHVVPDQYNHSSTQPQFDDQVGLVEEEPTDEERPFVRSGWFRGPRGPKTIVLHCPNCKAVSRWFRSADPKITLNPHRWGRLCGEQEDLRRDLAQYLGTIQLRTVLPLDWDHVWSEFQTAQTQTQSSLLPGDDAWQVHDDSARNFAVRLNEGIGAWTRVLAISPHADLCGDVTHEYLTCQQAGGRVDDCHAGDEHTDNMKRYSEIVDKAAGDPSGKSTQAGTLCGYVLHRAHFSSHDITSVMRKAALDYGVCGWWEL